MQGNDLKFDVYGLWSMDAGGFFCYYVVCVNLMPLDTSRRVFALLVFFVSYIQFNLL